MKVLSFSNVTKDYGAQGSAIRKVSFHVESGELTALAGPSGSGKSTILNLAAGLDTPSAGEVALLGKKLKKLSANQLSSLRRAAIGFVFQAYNLFPVLTALENVEYPLALNGINRRTRRLRAMQALEEVGLSDLARRFPRELSGGQQQRIAVARAIVSNPKLILADEPTANLDSASTKGLVELFARLNREHGTTFVFSTHDERVLKVVRRTLHILDGQIAEDTRK